MKLIYASEKKKILEKLKEQYGISKLPYLLIKFGEDKIRIYSGSLSNAELNTLASDLRIENIGLYFAKEEKDGIRLTLDGIQILKQQITKNIFELTKEQIEEWLRGSDLDIQTNRGFLMLQNDNEFLGCGKSTGERIANFIPKERRIK